jgi:hypothetical protein
VGSALPMSEPPPDIYIFDLATENLTQLTFDPDSDDGPVWSRDGSRIYYRARGGNADLPGANAAVYTLPAAGGAPELLTGSGAGTRPVPWSTSADGNTLLIVEATSLLDVNLATIDLGKSDGIKPLLDLPEPVTEPSLSPNGQWLVDHESLASSGPTEVNIRPFPDVMQQRRPIGRGRNPVFSADGSEIFFFDGEGLSVTPVEYSPFRVANPKKLFRGRYWYGVGGPDGSLGRAWDVDSKNDRFLMITLPAEDAGEAVAEASRVQIDVVLNWFEELERHVPKR